MKCHLKLHIDITLHYHQDYIVLCKDINPQRGRFCTRSLASYIPRSSEDRSSWVFFILVVCGHPGGRLQFSGGGSKTAWPVKLCTNKNLHFLTGGAGKHQYNDHKTVVGWAQLPLVFTTETSVENRRHFTYWQLSLHLFFWSVHKKCMQTVAAAATTHDLPILFRECCSRCRFQPYDYIIFRFVE